MRDWKDTFDDLCAYARGTTLKRGRRWSSWSIRFKPGDDSKLQIGQFWAPQMWERNATKAKSMKRNLADHLVVITELDSTGVTIIPKSARVGPKHATDIYTKEQCPYIDRIQYTPYSHNADWVQVDNTLNRMLYELGIGVNHQYAIGPLYHGFKWSAPNRDPVNIVGAVRYDASTGTLTPLSKQPKRVHDAVTHERINKGILHVSKIYNTWAKLGTTFNGEDMLDIQVRFFKLSEADKTAGYIPESKNTRAVLRKLDVVTRMEKLDPTNKVQAMELAVLIRAHMDHYLRTYRPGTEVTLHFDKRQREALRRRLQRFYNTVEYKVD